MPHEMPEPDCLEVPAEKGRGNLVWLASFPKSGNTWTRAFLTAYCWNQRSKPLVQSLSWIPMANSRARFDREVGLFSSDLHGQELLELRARHLDHTSSQQQSVSFFKVHDAYIHTPSGRPLYGLGATRLAVYILRHPFDVVVSYANHASCSLEDALDVLDGHQEDQATGSGASFCAKQFADRTLGWSENVLSWTQQSQVPLLVLRYEELKRDAVASFRQLLEEVGLPVLAGRLEQAVRDCAFDRLQAEEKEHGFREKMAGCASFFSEGRAGRGREALTPLQKARILKGHGHAMEMFGYATDTSP